EMGSPLNEKGRRGDEILHKVTLSSFYMGKYEVTQAQWNIVASLPMVNTFLLARPSGFKGDDNLPIEQVSWEDAVEFCARLSRLTGKAYRLPTEAEWEYAARAGTKGTRSGNLDEIAWYDKNSDWKTHVVGQKKANPWGLYDMYGNIYEWCWDLYGDYPSTDVVNPKGVESGATRILRGGGWGGGAEYCRSATRIGGVPVNNVNDVGFRLAMNE
ncbi:MAG: formylglycine-generating enzyme family protein, partial [Blastocatellia bacterium]